MKRPRRRPRPVTDDPEAEERRRQRNRSMWAFILAIFAWFLLRPTSEPLAVGAALVIGVGVYLFLGWRDAGREQREAERRARLERWAREDEAEAEREPRREV